MIIIYHIHKLSFVVNERFKNKYIVSNTVSVIYVTFLPNAGRYRIAINPNGVPIKFKHIINDAIIDESLH